MREKSKIYRGVSLLLAVIMLGLVLRIPAPKTEAASKIKIYHFIQLIVQSLELEVDNATQSPYLNAALMAGIVKEGDFTDYTDYITRTDAAVLLNRADEYLHGDKVSEKLLSTVLEKRISDIKKIPKNKRTAVAKAYSKGFIKGYSNGYYIQNRKFNGSEFMSTSDAKNIIAMLKDTRKRAKLSPDGQLIRTTNLPKNANKYEYILETYPNEFYEMKFLYQLNKYYFEPKELVHYASPARFKYIDFHGKDMKDILDSYKDIWMERVETNLQKRLNVDYRTVDNNWLNNLRGTYTQHGNARDDKKVTDDIKAYVKNVKKNKIVIQSKVISVEPSTLYLNMDFYVRVYVEFKVTYSGTKMTPDDLIYGDSTVLNGLKKDRWFKGVYDIQLGTINGTSDGNDYYITDDSLTHY